MASLPRYSRKSKLSPSELRTFRSAVASLKKKGLIKGKVDAKSAQPYFVRGGKTLAEQVNASHKQISPKKPLPSKLATANKLFSIRDLPHKHKSLAGLIRDLEENASSLDKLKKRDEVWAFQIAGANSLRTFDSIDLLLEMFHYPRDNPYAGIRGPKSKKDADFIYDKLKLVRWTKTNREWKESSPIQKKKRARKRKR